MNIESYYRVVKKMRKSKVQRVLSFSLGYYFATLQIFRLSGLSHFERQSKGQASSIELSHLTSKHIIISPIRFLIHTFLVHTYIMKLAIALLTLSQCQAFAPSLTHPQVQSSMVALNANLGADMSGNTWKPDAERGNTNQMGSTDTGDFFP
jgi:hypothetical protein